MNVACKTSSHTRVSKPLRQMSLGTCLLAGLAFQPVWGAEEGALARVFTEGKINLDFRYRYEHVDQDNALRNAHASTLRSRLTVQSGAWQGLSLLGEADNVRRLGSERYNDTRNGRTDYSVVADPTGSEVNQLLLRYQHTLGSAQAGRQRIVLDNQRYVGGVAWRQNEQTYDGFMGQLKPVSDVTLTYAYIDQVNTIFGPEGQNNFPGNPANIEGHSHLVNLGWDFLPGSKVTAYHYRLGLDNLSGGTQSSHTTGVRLTGGHGTLTYTLEYARQKDHADNPLELDSRYILAELGYQENGYSAKIGYELLGGDSGPGNRAFQTPLATKHAFQGWADMFLLTPADGIANVYVGGSMPLWGGSLQAWYHDFRADKGSAKYGRELDVAYARAIPQVKGLSVLLKGAFYDARDFGVDTNKLWVQVQYQY